MAKPESPSNGNAHLRPVPDDADAAPAEEGGGRSALLTIVLAVALFVALLGWVLAWQGGRELQAELEVTQSALARAETRIDALTGTLGQAREATSDVLLEVDGLRDRLSELEALLLAGAAGDAATAAEDAPAPPDDAGEIPALR